MSLPDITNNVTGKFFLIIIYGLTIIYVVLVTEKRAKISLSLPFCHALEGGREVNRFGVHVSRKAQNFASIVLRGL